MKRLLIALLLLSITAGAGWWYWTTTPQFAVQQAAKAIKNHDVVAFHTWVNVEEVSSNAIDDLLSEPARAVGGTSILERVVGISLISIFKPNVVQSIVQQIDRWIAKHPPTPANAPPATDGLSVESANSESNAAATDQDELSGDEQINRPKSFFGAIAALIKPPQLKQLFRQYGFTKKNYRGLGQVNSADKMAHVGLRFFNPKLQSEVEVMLELEQNNGHWQITRISNLPELLTVLAHTGP